MSDTEATPADELVRPDGSHNWDRANELIRTHRDESENLRHALALEHEQRRQAEAARAAQDEQIGDLRAELAFTRAGVDTANTAGRRFAETYDGPLEREAIEQAYSGYLADHLTASVVYAEHVARTQPRNGHGNGQRNVESRDSQHADAGGHAPRSHLRQFGDFS